MTKILSSKQAISILVMFTLGTSVISGVAKPAKEDAWISILLAALISVPFYLVYAQLMITFKNKNLFEICEVVFGKLLGNIMTAIFIFNGFYLSAILIRRISDFMGITGLDGTPPLYIMLLIILVCIYMLKKDVSIFGKWCQFYMVIVMVVILFEFTSLFSIRNIDYLFPVLYNGASPVIKATANALGFPFLQCGHLLYFLNVLDEKASYRKVFMYGLLISTIILLLITFENITVLGGTIYSKSYFPSYLTFRRLAVGNFIRRIESLSVLMFLILSFVKLTSALLGTVIGVQSMFKLKTYKNVVVPVAFLCCILAILAWEDLVELENLSGEIYFYYSIAINATLPVLIYVIFLIKTSIMKSLKQKATQ